jgi:hypothetical protein
MRESSKHSSKLFMKTKKFNANGAPQGPILFVEGFPTLFCYELASNNEVIFRILLSRLRTET